jgi:hypothetical protein
MRLRTIALVCAGLASGMLHLKADDLNQESIFTFSEPVEIPGQVLSAGAYVFKLADSPSDHNIVLVYGAFLAIPDYRINPADKPTVQFEERVAGSPEAVGAWFYPGDDCGHEFVYPKVKPAAGVAKRIPSAASGRS